MTEAPVSPGGFTARLLDRAEGRVSALRPGIAPVFAAEQARAAPVLARSEEMPTVPAAQAAQRDARAELPRSPVATAGSHAPEIRLMPNSSERAESRQIAEPQPDTEGEPAALQPDPAQAHEPAAQLRIATESLLGEPSDPDRLRPTPLRPKRGDSLSAAVMQLLGESGSGTADAGPAIAGTFPPEPHRGVRESLPTEREPGASAAQLPIDPVAAPALTIHIGEIVVAPEPGPASPAAPSPPPWQPPLSLSEYRARRAQERR